jgi:acyl carrier protein
MPAPETIRRVKNVICASLKLEDGIAISNDMALAGGAYDMDSLDILLIVTGVEKEFGFKIDDTKLTKAAFKSVESLAAFVDSCAAASNSAHPVDGHER